MVNNEVSSFSIMILKACSIGIISTEIVLKSQNLLGFLITAHTMG